MSPGSQSHVHLVRSLEGFSLSPWPWQLFGGTKYTSRLSISLLGTH